MTRSCQRLYCDVAYWKIKSPFQLKGAIFAEIDMLYVNLTPFQACTFWLNITRRTETCLVLPEQQRINGEWWCRDGWWWSNPS